MCDIRVQTEKNFDLFQFTNSNLRLRCSVTTYCLIVMDFNLPPGASGPKTLQTCLWVVLISTDRAGTMLYPAPSARQLSAPVFWSLF